MKKTLIIVGLAGLISLVSVFSVSAWQGEKLRKSFSFNEEKIANMEELREERQQSREALGQAMLDKDYASWSELKTDRSPCFSGDLITEENFALFTEAHQLIKDGKIDEAKEIFQALGKEMPEKRMGKPGSFMAEGSKPHQGRRAGAPWGNNFQNQ